MRYFYLQHEMPEKKSSLSTALQTRKKPDNDTFTLNGWLIFKSIKY